jgi:hypothetical protein
MSDNTKKYFAKGRRLHKSGHSVVASLPKETLRDYGIVDDSGELVETVEAQPYIDEAEGTLGVELALDD